MYSPSPFLFQFYLLRLIIGRMLPAVKNHTEYGDTFLGWRRLGLEPFCFVVEGLEGLIVDFGVGDVICAGV